MIRCMVLWGLVAAQLSTGDLHQFHKLTVAIPQHPCGFETPLAADMHLVEQTSDNVCLRSLSCVTEVAEHLHFLTGIMGYVFRYCYDLPVWKEKSDFTLRFTS